MRIFGSRRAESDGLTRAYFLYIEIIDEMVGLAEPHPAFRLNGCGSA